MASPTLKELKYRRFDELMDEIYIDLPSFTREGMVEPGQLVKVAQRVNYELGLKIHTYMYFQCSLGYKVQHFQMCLMLHQRLV